MNNPPISGPSTVVTPKTAPSAPWYLPRSRSGITSAISAIAVTIRRAGAEALERPASRSARSCCAPAPHSADARTKVPAATWKTRLRPNRSPNLPASTVAIVSASRYDDTTQDRWPAPPRSPDDRRQRRRHDRLVERRQQHSEQQGAEHQVHPPPVQDGQLRVNDRLLGRHSLTSPLVHSRDPNASLTRGPTVD